MSHGRGQASAPKVQPIISIEEQDDSVAPLLAAEVKATDQKPPVLFPPRTLRPAPRLLQDTNALVHAAKGVGDTFSYSGFHLSATANPLMSTPLPWRACAVHVDLSVDACR